MKCYEPTGDEWYKETFLYIMDINGTTKFGITANWERRQRAYQKEIGNLVFRVIKRESFNKRWKAELIEQVMKWRLRPWCINGRHEWINAPIQLVLNCYLDTRDTLLPEIEKYYYIHETGADRWSHYKQLVDMTFDKK